MNHAKELAFEEDFRVRVVGRHLELTKPIEDYVLEKVGKVEKFSHHKVDLMVRLEVQKQTHIVHIAFKFSHVKVAVHAETDNLYSAIDRAFEKLAAKLRRWKSRIQDHHAKALSVVDLQVNVFDVPDVDATEEYNEEIEAQHIEEIEKALEPPKVVKKKTRLLKTLRADEAVMKMELSGDHFLLYRSEEDQNLKVMYRRRDGTYGIIDSQQSA